MSRPHLELTPHIALLLNVPSCMALLEKTFLMESWRLALSHRVLLDNGLPLSLDRVWEGVRIVAARGRYVDCGNVAGVHQLHILRSVRVVRVTMLHYRIRLAPFY